jgi:2-phospho-L-lactate guanylyltransferase
MRPSDLAEGLDACTAELLAGAVRAVVPDAAGDGTVLMAATHPAALHPSYGPGSGTRHAVGGVLLDLPNERLRRDVDTPDDLAVVAELGVGPATAAALRTDIHGVV